MTAPVLAVIAAGACSSAARSPSNNVVSPAAQATVDSGRPRYAAADARFMSGMMVHHAQAVLIAGWAPAHGASPALRELCARIVVSQQDEIAFMQRWLRERRLTLPDTGAAPPHMMPATDHSIHMPGMLTPEQLAQLDAARGPEFDRLFLTFMIQHHRGAITMVQQLVTTQGAAQDGVVFRFAADVDADQNAEIDRMGRMLESLPSGGASR